MATSGTYTFSPSNGEIVLASYARCGVRRTAILAEHMLDARNELNFLLSEWSNRQVNLWTVDLVTTTLVSGTAAYDVDASTVMILDAYIETGSGSTLQDRIIMPISRTEYAAMPNKTTQAAPTSFWFDRLIAPTVTMWPVPDSNGPYTLKYYRCRQIQDANLTGGETPEIPYRWIDALASGLTARLAAIYRPEIADKWDAKAERAWQIASSQDTENTPVYLTPALGGYFR